MKLTFPKGALRSGGSVTRDGDIHTGPWTITQWPGAIPEDEKLRAAITKLVNDLLPKGCCGGCR